MASGVPLVSVIMPVRDGGAYLAEAVDSILGQSMGDLELIVIDDHSGDGAIERLPGDEARLRLTKNPGRGIVSALNEGISRAEGTFVARMDADDVSLPGRLEAQLDYFENNPELSLCGACVEIFSDGPVRGGNRRYEAWLNSVRDPGEVHKALFIESPIPHPTAMIRRDALRQLGGYRDRGWPEDYDLFLRADGAGQAMGKPDGILLRWRDHGRRLTRLDPTYDLARFQDAKAHFLVRDRLCGRPVLIWGAGKSGRQMHDALRRAGAEVAAFVDVHPRRIGGVKRELPVWPIERAANWCQGMILVAVGAPGARQEIGSWLERRGRSEGIDYLFVA
jgi:glycosyltransferase involved in cell wall biosynthesis